MYALDARTLPRPILDPRQVRAVAAALGCPVAVVRAIASYSYALGEEPIPGDLPAGIDPAEGSEALRAVLGDDRPFLFAWTPPAPEVRRGAFGLLVPTATTAAAEALLDAIAFQELVSDFNRWDQQLAAAAVYEALEAFSEGTRRERPLPATPLDRPPYWQDDEAASGEGPAAIALLDQETLVVRAGGDLRLVSLPSRQSPETVVAGGRDAGRRIADNPTAPLFRALPGGFVLFLDREEATLALLDTGSGEWLRSSPIAPPLVPFAPYKSDRWEVWDRQRGMAVALRTVDNRRGGALFDDRHVWIEGDTAIVDLATGAIEYTVHEDEDDNPPQVLAFSANSQSVLYASGELWRGDRCVLRGPPPTCAAFSPDGRRLVLGHATTFTVIDH